MPRRVPNSHKKKRDAILNARAVKRGDVEQTDAAKEFAKAKAVLRSARSDQARGDSFRALESRFVVALPSDYAETTRLAAYNDVLTRPLPSSSAVFPLDFLTRPEVNGLSCPVRPKFRKDATKKEVERNEEGVFRKWLDATSQVMQDWMNEGAAEIAGPSEEQPKGKAVIPRSPSWFETNLEVWRQLWRVVESASIVILLLDSRCPPLHAPPSLRSYLKRSRKEVVLALTKSDLVDPRALAMWKDWVKEWWSVNDEKDKDSPERGEVDVVAVTSYDEELLEAGRHKPLIPDTSRAELMAAIQRAHARLLQPPTWAHSDPSKLAQWQPSARETVDWASLGPDHEAVNGQGETGSPEDALTIGLVGQPNVGKSSLINALIGTTKVRASRTPGKTKHFQTIFWGSKREVKIVDCPGLVCPSLVPMELQTLAGIIQISQIASLMACVHFAARHMPIEEIFHIPPPPPKQIEVDPWASKRTWRKPKDAPPPPEQQPESEKALDEMVEEAKKEEKPVEPIVEWTAGGMLESRAEDRGCMTAQSGRPDTTRAADSLMRALADGRVRWGFWPIDDPSRTGRGIFLGAKEGSDVNAERDRAERHVEDEEEDGEDDDEEVGDEDEEEEDEEQDEDDGFARQNAKSFFDALDGADDDEEEEEDVEEEEEGEDDE